MKEQLRKVFCARLEQSSLDSNFKIKSEPGEEIHYNQRIHKYHPRADNSGYKRGSWTLNKGFEFRSKNFDNKSDFKPYFPPGNMSQNKNSSEFLQ